MLDGKAHVAALQEAFDVLSGGASEQESVAAGVVGLYGLRVMAASAAHFSRPDLADEFAQRWSALKRETSAVGVYLNKELDASGQKLGVKALRHRPDYRNFREDALTRAMLILDKLGAAVGRPEDERGVSKALDLFLTRRVRGHVDTTTQHTTPTLLNTLAAQLVTIDLEYRFRSVYDPACGVGGSLIAVHQQLMSRGIARSNIAYHGQDVNAQAVFIAAWNLLLSGIGHVYLEVGDALREPRFLSGSELKRFDLVITQPPAYYVADDDFGPNDPYRRFRYGTVQSSRADYAFVQHAVASLRPEGQAVVIMPLTTFSRSGFEQEIRANLVHAGVVSTSISFQGGMPLAKNTPAGMLLLNLERMTNELENFFFIDAPVEKAGAPTQGPERSTVPEQALLDTYRLRRTRQGLSKAATLEEIKAHRYSLAPQAYIPRKGSGPVFTGPLDKHVEAAEQEVHEASAAFRRALTSLQRKRRPSVGIKKATEQE